MLANKKSQAAIEFLTTYAWVILGILILIGSLAYFGVLNPSKLLPDRCNAGSEIGCMQSVIKENGLQLRLINNVGSTIIVDTVSVLDGETSLCTTSPLADPWQAGKTIDLPVVCSGFSSAEILADEKKKLGFEIIYHTPQGGDKFKKYVQGEVFATVQEGNVVGITPIFEDNFDAALDANKWPTLTNVVANTDCGAVSNPNSLKFVGGGVDVDRIAETKALDSSKARTITFQIRGVTSDVGSCLSPDTSPSEDLLLEYLPSGGSWTLLTTYAAGTPLYQTFQPITVTLPSGAKIASTKFRWRQDIHDSTPADNWAIDNVVIQ